MFHKTSITPKLEDTKFIEVTSKSISLFNDLLVEDKTNITPDQRDVAQYNKYLQVDLVEAILQLAKLTGRKIDLLDSGCGKAVVIDELLSNPKLNDALGTCTGVSMNYFTNIKTVMEKHGDRFHFFYGKVQDVLEQTHLQFDLILDMAGAHAYSVDKINLMKLYHQALKPGGKAEILHYKVYVAIEEETKPTTAEIASFYPKIAEKHPKTFFDKNNMSLTMSKASRQFPLPAVEVTQYLEYPTSKKKISLRRLRGGNAVAPAFVQYHYVENGGKRRRLS